MQAPAYANLDVEIVGGVLALSVAASGHDLMGRLFALRTGRPRSQGSPRQPSSGDSTQPRASLPC